MNFYVRKTKKDITLSEKNEKRYKNNNICLFCDKETLIDKVTDHCLLTGCYRGPTHSRCNIDVKQKQSNFKPLIFLNFSNYDCHLFFKKLVDKKNYKLEFNIIPKTNEE